MTTSSKIAKIIDVFHQQGIELDLHAEHDILLFCEDDRDIPYKDALISAGAFFSNEYNSWAVYCSA